MHLYYIYKYFKMQYYLYIVSICKTWKCIVQVSICNTIFTIVLLKITPLLMEVVLKTGENVILPVIEERAGFSSGVAGSASSSTSPPLLHITPSSSIAERSQQWTHSHTAL